ncbi:glycosyltransferase [Shinella sp. H4-D48]|uniref:glycosyltransferase family 4 protein n=1 Tax=Shinella sp. H4-D48 TaxID=2925841 RepID=UPI001F52DB79|nr:glycosyltransferase [Shinella sp. H4-D48]UNK38240.1 glycosyltransferase [Shinella sp. H4-D48]
MTFKVLHVITGLDDGGAEAVLFRLVSAVPDKTEHVVVSLTDAGKYGALLEAQGTRVLCLGMQRGRASIGALRQLVAFMRKEQPDVVQTWMYHANFLGGICAKVARLPTVVWGIHHTHLVPGMASRSTRAIDWLCARISNFVPTKIIACAKAAEDVHVGKGYDQRKVKVVANGYDINRWCRSEDARQDIRTELGIPDSCPLIGFVARWDPLKDHSNLVSAIALVRHNRADLRVMLVGKGCIPENSELVSLLERAGIAKSVCLLGARSDVPRLMCALDLHVLSSRSEAFPNVVAEAMACETPCVVTAVGDASEIVGATGWCVPVENSQLLAAAIVDALEEWSSRPSLWSERRRQARQRIVSQFSIEAMVQGYQDVWDECGSLARS